MLVQAVEKKERWLKQRVRYLFNKAIEHVLMCIVVGPVGTRFHHKCLKCFCGKQLDSGAKSFEEVGPDGRLERRFACRTCIVSAIQGQASGVTEQILSRITRISQSEACQASLASPQ